mmetsp:Transcript_22826/g.45589  ORF Transcript_22826/g.45589 Transcript_22826/m.45589 type:complete len:156 (+) Transcript_22826:161-628(+)
MIEDTPRIEEDKPCLVGAESPMQSQVDDPNNGDIIHDDGDEDLEEDYPDKDRWDEGGRSDCGYSDGVHETLMSIGEKVYKLVGEPSETMQKRMKGIGSFFQEASYAVRDIKRGNFRMKDGDVEPAEDDSDDEPDQREEGVANQNAEANNARTEVE